MNPYSRLPKIYDAALSRRNWVTALDQVAEGTAAKGVMLRTGWYRTDLDTVH